MKSKGQGRSPLWIKGARREFIFCSSKMLDLSCSKAKGLSLSSAVKPDYSLISFSNTKPWGFRDLPPSQLSIDPVFQSLVFLEGGMLPAMRRMSEHSCWASPGITAAPALTAHVNGINPQRHTCVTRTARTPSAPLFPVSVPHANGEISDKAKGQSPATQSMGADVSSLVTLTISWRCLCL